VSERPLTDLVASLPASAAPQLANPAALASELFGSLRAYFERVQNPGKVSRTAQSSSADRSNGVGVTLTSLGGDPRMDLHGGPARDVLDSVDAYGGLPPAARIGLAQLQRAEELALASMNLSTETTLVAGGAQGLSRSVNTLLRGQ